MDLTRFAEYRDNMPLNRAEETEFKKKLGFRRLFKQVLNPNTQSN